MSSKQEIKKRIEKLKKEISKYRYAYHVLNQQLISDSVLDSLKHQLYSLEQQFPEFITDDSPTQRVAGAVLPGFSKYKHKRPMISIEDIFDEKELQDWEDYLKKLTNFIAFDYFCEMKIDGFAICLIYKNGVFSRGATRGDGKIGEDVTQNLKTIESIPLKLRIHKSLPNQQIEKTTTSNIQEGIIEIRGEVYMDKKDFERFNEQKIRKGDKPYANPRNLAAGSIRQIDPRLAASRKLKFLAYDIVTNLGQVKHSQEHEILEAIGFNTDKGKKCANLKQVENFCDKVEKRRNSLPFQIDGVVINVDDNKIFEKLGVAGKSWRASRAFKFSAKQAVTVVKNIRTQIGRTGAITPIAELEPVKIEGITISRATLHNEDQIKKLGIKIYDTVIIERAGDVIPAVVEVLFKLRTGREKSFQMPKNCVSCGEKLIKDEKGAILRCPNKDCFARRKESLYHFVSKKAFNIDHLGPKIIDQLIDQHLISDPSDLFTLTQGDLVLLERQAKKSSENLISAIAESKKIDFEKFIYSLGIRQVGEETAIDLSKKFGSLEKLKNASIEELEAVRDIGEIASQAIYNWFSSKKH
jgi:DNA ligase (NAD+)